MRHTNVGGQKFVWFTFSLNISVENGENLQFGVGMQDLFLAFNPKYK